jgi:hypothetical protein
VYGDPSLKAALLLGLGLVVLIDIVPSGSLFFENEVKGGAWNY